MNANTRSHVQRSGSKNHVNTMRTWSTFLIVAAVAWSAWSIAMTADGQTVKPAVDPRIGTWKLNLAKSLYPSGLAPQSQTLKWEPTEDGGYKLTTDGVDAEGQTTHTETIGKLDGKEHPAQIGAQGEPRTGSVRRLDDYTFESITTFKGLDGEMVSLVRLQRFSADGKTMTSISSRRDPQGRILPIMAVYERQ